jgi:hypothetical protein
MRAATVVSAILVAILVPACATEAPTPVEESDVAETRAEIFGSPFDHLDLDDPVDNLTALVKLRTSLDPDEEVYFYFVGNIYTMIPQVPRAAPLFRLEGVNVARTVRVDGGYQQLSREIMVYRDPITNEILRCWNNPLNGKRVTVLDVVNDPVNFTFLQATWRVLPTLELGGRVIIGNDVVLGFPNPLPPAQYPDFSAGFFYQTAELFNYSTNRLELDARFLKGTLTGEVSWTRVGQFLPWMQMGAAPGMLMYQARGFKLSRFSSVPAELRNYVRANYPAFEHAPAAFSAPNESSWTYFKKKFDAGEYPLTCP